MFKKIILLAISFVAVIWLFFVLTTPRLSEPSAIVTNQVSSSTSIEISVEETDLIFDTPASVITSQIVLDLEPKIVAEPQPVIKADPEIINDANFPKTIILSVPFTSQAPLAEWSDPRQQDGCEEAAVLMAMAWALDFKFDKAKAKQEIVAMADYQIEKFGSSIDTNSADTLARLINGYWDYDLAEVVTKFDKQILIDILQSGRLIIAPTNGRKLGNPNFTAPGPTTHMIVIKGYDFATDQFITNDPGTRNGENYRYSSKVILNAIVDYPTGKHLPQDPSKQAIIVVSK